MDSAWFSDSADHALNPEQRKGIDFYLGTPDPSDLAGPARRYSSLEAVAARRPNAR